MAIIKCKMCGGDLNVQEGMTVAECEYCGTKQTVPTVDNEKKITLFGRAGRLLRACEFDKASGVFESIVAEFPEEAEAYWGLVLCKFGIEYVDDPATGKKVPTCHRSSFNSIFDDSNFEQACENADVVARGVYRSEAKAIEELRKGIIEVSAKEEPYDVFISYKEKDESGERTIDSVIAQDIYTELTDKGYRVFFSRISLEDKLGVEYEPYIFAALNSAKLMLVVGTNYDNFEAVWVKNEWSRFLSLMASGQKKTLIPCFKDIDAYDMPKEFNKLAAQDMGKVGAMQDLIRGVEKILGSKQKTSTKETVVVHSEGDMKTAAAVKRGNMALEDGDWEKADEYFEQALTLDAECAEAYVGKLLVENKKKNLEEYFEQLRASVPTPTYNTKHVAIDEEAYKRSKEKYYIKNYFDEARIKEIYLSDNSYKSCLNSSKEIRAAYTQKLEDNRKLSRAMQFADGELKEQLENKRKAYLTYLDELVELAEKSEEDQLKSMDEVDKQIEKMHRKAKAQQESDYKFADNLVKKAKSKQSYEDAKSIFEFLGNYKDAPERVIQCQNKIESIEEKQRKAEERAAAERKAAEERAEAERKAAAEKAERERQEKIAKLNAEKTSLQDELANLKGLFSGKRRKEIEVQIAKIDRQLAAVDAELGRTQN